MGLPCRPPEIAPAVSEMEPFIVAPAALMAMVEALLRAHFGDGVIQFEVITAGTTK